MSENPARLTNKEVLQRNADIFNHYLSAFHGDVYLTAINCFPDFTFLRDVSVVIDPNTSILAGGVVGDNEPRVYIGTQPGTVTPQMKTRILERFQLHPDLAEMPYEAFGAFIFAHELGHVLQDDPQFERFYGDGLNEVRPDPKKDYAGYVESPRETNADFIAAEIIANTDLGRMIGFMPPVEGPSEWKEWAAQHPVPKTISMALEP